MMTTIAINDRQGRMLAQHTMHNNVFLLTLSKAMADGANLDGADLSGQSLKGLDFRHAKLPNASFCGCDLRGAVLTDAVFDHADFSGAQFSPTPDFSRSSLNGATLPER